MAIYYFDAAAGTTGSGTAVSPWNATQIATMVATVANNDTVNFSGLLENVWTSGRPFIAFTQTGLTLQQWAGKNRFFILGAKGVVGTWTTGGADVNTINLATDFGEAAASIVPDCVMYKYLDTTKQNAQGARKCFLLRAATAIAAAATGNSWFYDSATGILTVNITGLGAGLLTTTSGKIDPADPTSVTLSDIYVGRRSAAPILFSMNGSNSTLDGLWGGCSSPMSNSAAYGFYSGSNGPSVIKNCRFWDAAFHCIASYSNSGLQSGVQFIDCDAYCAGTSGGSGGTPFVSYSGTGNMTGVSYLRCRAFASYYLGVSGNEVAVGSGETALGVQAVSGFFFHTTGAASRVTDIQYSGCIAWCGTMNGNMSVGFGGGNMRPSSGNISSMSDARNYAVRIMDSQILRVQTTASGSLVPPSLIFGGPVAYQRCVMDFNWTFTSTVGYRLDGASPPVPYYRIGTTSAFNHNILLESCDIRLAQGDPSVAATIGTNFGLGNTGASQNCKMILNNCTITIFSNMSVGFSDTIFTITQDPLFIVNNCLIVNAGNVRNKICQSTTFGPASVAALRRFLEMRGNVYVGFDSATGYASQTQADAAAEWTAVLADSSGTTTSATDGPDPAAPTIAYSAGDFVNINTSGALSPGSAIRSYLRPTATPPDYVRSIDGFFHSGVGAYGYGATPVISLATLNQVLPTSMVE